jgi:phage FluMu protein Com
MTDQKRVWRSGVRFDCAECGKLLKDDAEHSESIDSGCPKCGGNLRLVGQGERMVEHAQWFRCLACEQLYMKRRGEIVETKPRSGFVEFTTL